MVVPVINPEILIWARETAGLSLDEAARVLSSKLASYEAGEIAPSRALLKRMAKKYRRSLLVFYLSEPPITGDRGRDFRTLPDSLAGGGHEANLDALIRDINARQNLVRSLLEDDDEDPLVFVKSATTRQAPERLVRDIVLTLGFELSKFRAKRTIIDAFGYLRKCVEDSGIFVLLVGNLGTYHTDIPAEVFRGFAIADPIAPFVVVNDQDARTAWSFTALHEVAHLWLGETGVSGTSYDLAIERFCNEVASSILLPSQELGELQGIQDVSFDEATSEITRFAEQRNISRAMVAYNLLLSGVVSDAVWRKLKSKFDNDRLELKEKLKGRKTGGSYYATRRHRLGKPLLGLVNRSIGDGVLSSTKAGRLLGVKAVHVNSLLNPLVAGGGL
jgi:Zn-dependent peptidase ImmA (M78 family)